jgi:transposase
MACHMCRERVSALARARESPEPCRWGIENSGSLGKGFAQFLLAHDERAVHEIVLHRTALYRKRSRTQDTTDHADALSRAGDARRSPGIEDEAW